MVDLLTLNDLRFSAISSYTDFSISGAITYLMIHGWLMRFVV
jgi:hypothetical protein